MTKHEIHQKLLQGTLLVAPRPSLAGGTAWLAMYYVPWSPSFWPSCDDIEFPLPINKMSFMLREGELVVPLGDRRIGFSDGDWWRVTVTVEFERLWTELLNRGVEPSALTESWRSEFPF